MIKKNIFKFQVKNNKIFQYTLNQKKSNREDNFSQILITNSMQNKENQIFIFRPSFDQVKGKHFLQSNLGKKVQCKINGQICSSYIPGITGYASSHLRKQYQQNNDRFDLFKAGRTSKNSKQLQAKSIKVNKNQSNCCSMKVGLGKKKSERKIEVCKKFYGYAQSPYNLEANKKYCQQNYQNKDNQNQQKSKLNIVRKGSTHSIGLKDQELKTKARTFTKSLYFSRTKLRPKSEISLKKKLNYTNCSQQEQAFEGWIRKTIDGCQNVKQQIFSEACTIKDPLISYFQMGFANIQESKSVSLWTSLRANKIVNFKTCCVSNKLLSHKLAKTGLRRQNCKEERIKQYRDQIQKNNVTIQTHSKTVNKQFFENSFIKKSK